MKYADMFLGITTFTGQWPGTIQEAARSRLPQMGHQHPQ
jgi:hypothetical protein